MLWNENMLRPPDSRVDLVPELMALVREPTFVRPSYRSIGMLGGCQSPPNNFAQVGSKDPPAQRNWKVYSNSEVWSRNGSAFGPSLSYPP